MEIWGELKEKARERVHPEIVVLWKSSELDLSYHHTLSFECSRGTKFTDSKLHVP